MISVSIFGEDHAHEVILRTLLECIADSRRLAIDIRVRSAIGGHGRMTQELRQYLNSLRRGRAPLPDLVVIGRDANCAGYADSVSELNNLASEYTGLLVNAVPDPHVERWLLIDSQAFKRALGAGCKAPDLKCDRDRYKQLLAEAIRLAGVEPLLGGVEFAADIIQHMDLDRASKADASFGHLLRDLRSALNRLQTP